MRTKYVYARDEAGELIRNEAGELVLVEAGSDYRPDLRDGHCRSEAEIYGNCVATDGADLSSRRRHREYMERNGLTVASDYKQSWETAHNERKKVFAGDWDNEGRRQDVVRAFEQAEKRSRR